MTATAHRVRSDRSIADLGMAAWDYLQRHARGRDRAVPQAELARILACNDRMLQNALLWLLEEQNRLVCSSCKPPMGVFVPVTLDEKTAYREQLRARLIGAARRIALVRQAPLWPAPAAHQTTLFPTCPEPVEGSESRA